MIDLDALEAVAKEATAGPWMPENVGNIHWSVRAVFKETGKYRRNVAIARCDSDGFGNGCTEEDAKFIATPNPETILSLISRLRAAEEVVTRGRCLQAECSDSRNVLLPPGTWDYQDCGECPECRLNASISIYDKVKGETE